MSHLTTLFAYLADKRKEEDGFLHWLFCIFLLTWSPVVQSTFCEQAHKLDICCHFCSSLLWQGHMFCTFVLVVLQVSLPVVGAGDGRQGKWEATGHIVKLQDSSEEVTMELRDSQKLPIDTTTGKKGMPECQRACMR